MGVFPFQVTLAVPLGPEDFYSSFEEADPILSWESTNETDGEGNSKTEGIDGSPKRIPGDITKKVVEITAKGENAPNEPKEKGSTSIVGVEQRVSLLVIREIFHSLSKIAKLE